LVGQITVYSGPELRQQWTDEQRQQILTGAFAPGASPTEVARRHEISTGLLYTWRKKLSVGEVAPVTLIANGLDQHVIAQHFLDGLKSRF
jgi:transposase